ncbi:MAG: porin family protein [Candidatus Kapabacteria bacterium]|nr:porin family protein [Candidatus Kapabacteria bacterium]
MKYFFVVIIFIFALNEDIHSQIFGIKAGLNLSDMYNKRDQEEVQSNMKPGFHIGATAEFPISKMFAFESGILLSNKGYKVDISETQGGVTATIKQNVSMYYLDIPITAKLYLPVGSAKFCFLAGPYLALGLSGTATTELTVNGQTQKKDEDVNFGSDEDELKPLDYGLIFGAGIEFSNFTFGINYNLGLANLLNNTEFNSTINHKVIGISAGYKFN